MCVTLVQLLWNKLEQRVALQAVSLFFSGFHRAPKNHARKQEVSYLHRVCTQTHAHLHTHTHESPHSRPTSLSMPSMVTWMFPKHARTHELDESRLTAVAYLVWPPAPTVICQFARGSADQHRRVTIFHRTNSFRPRKIASPSTGLDTLQKVSNDPRNSPRNTWKGSAPDSRRRLLEVVPLL